MTDRILTSVLDGPRQWQRDKVLGEGDPLLPEDATASGNQARKI